MTSSSHFQFNVIDARLKKGMADPTMDFSDHWWDENDPSWGLFIRQDSANNMMAAWFTHTPDGKSAWYVFQPVWAFRAYTRYADGWQTNKPLSPSSPSAGTANFTTVGQAELDFYFGNYKFGTSPVTVELFDAFNYSFSDGPIQKRTLMRFKAR